MLLLLPAGVPVMWEGMVVGSSLPGLAPTNLAARTAGLSEDALHASLLAEPGTCIDSPDVLPASKRQRMVQQASGLGPSGSQQQQQQQAQQQGDLLADDDEAMASLSVSLPALNLLCFVDMRVGAAGLACVGTCLLGAVCLQVVAAAAAAQVGLCNRGGLLHVMHMQRHTALHAAPSCSPTHRC